MSFGAANLPDRINDGQNMETVMDRLGALPDDLLRYLMSFLPSPDSVRTCVLAKRWSTLWKTVPALRIDDDRYIDHLFRLRDPTPLNVCDISFHCVHPDTYYCEETFKRIEPWFQYALSHRVQELRVNAALSTTNLTVVSSHLKRVELCGMHFEHSLDFSSCGGLDVLDIRCCRIHASILCPSVRHLEIITAWFDQDTRHSISAPNLISLELHPNDGLTPSFDSMPSLVTASVDVYCNWDVRNTSTVDYVLLKGLSNATDLELTTVDYELSIFRMDLKLHPTFSKLKNLMLNKWFVYDDFVGLVYFLHHSPILEMLTLHLDFQNFEIHEFLETDENSSSRGQGHNSRGQSLLSQHLKAVKILSGKKADVILQRTFDILSTHGVPSEKIEVHIESNFCSPASFRARTLGFGIFDFP